MAHQLLPARGRVRWPEDSKLPKRSRAVATVALALALGALTGAPAEAGSRLSERQLRQLETQTLGAEHAREHAVQRAAARRHAARPPRRRIASAANSADPAQAGSWSGPFAGKTFGIHAALLPTGKVMLWGYPVASGGVRPNYGQAWLYDPAKGTGDGAWTEVAPPLINGQPAPIYCSGQSLLADGRLLVAGGNLRYAGASGGWLGLQNVFTFDPWTESWTQQPDMRNGRWYPSQLLLPSGATALLGGYTDDEPGNADSSDFELFQPGAGTRGSIELKASAARRTALYPHLFTMSDGQALLAGPARGDSARLRTDSWSWEELPPASINRIGGSAVLRPSGSSAAPTKVTQIGGHDYQGANQDHAALASSETLDYSRRGDGWTAEPAQLNVARSYHNTVLLPDRSMVTVGGGAGRTVADGTFAVYGDGRARQVELWDPATGGWRLGAAQAEDRGYHSTALLLPDGRVLSTGDDKHPVDTADTVEIYSPPYLFRGSRPVVSSLPDASRWSDVFGVATTAEVASVVLVAPGQTTHGADMHQRLVQLRISERLAGRGVNVATPASANVAPPGWYMLFVVDERGVPSVGRWLRLGADAPDVPILLASGAPQIPPAADSGSDDPGEDEDSGDDRPPPSSGGEGDTTPPRIDVQIGHTSVARLLAGKKVKVVVRSNERGRVELALSPGWLSFERSVRFARPGRRTIWFKPRLAAHWRLHKLSGLRLTVKAWFRDDARNQRYDFDRRSIRRSDRR